MSQGEKGEPGADSVVAGPTGAAGAAGAEGAVGRTGQQGEAGPAALLDPVTAAGIKKSVRLMAIATVAVYAVVIGLSIYVYALASANQDRIDEIQVARESSCRQTYEGIREVFRPFFPPEPRTVEQQADLDKFNRTIDTRKAACGKQTESER